MPYEPLTVAEKMRLARVMIELRRALIVGNPAPIVSDMWRRHKAPQPGDWVMETSTIHRLLRPDFPYSDDDRKALWDGQFTRFVRSEMRHHPEEDGGVWSEQVYICENPDGTEYAWTNAELAVVPLEQSLASEHTLA